MRRVGVAATATVCAVVLTTAGAAARGDVAAGRTSVRGAHDCVPNAAAERRRVRIAWSRLHNPIFALDHMVKDQAIRWIDGRWHLFYSERTEQGPGLGGTAHSVSPDLARWREAKAIERGGSPDITRGSDGRYLITYQQALTRNPDISKLYVVSARQVGGRWTKPRRLLRGIFEEERTIDGAFAHTGSGLFLLFKRGLHTAVVQHAEVAWSPSGSPAGPWQLVGEPDFPLAENFQLLPIDGTWHLLATEIPIHRPVLYRLTGDASEPASWVHWELVRRFDVPQEAWNTGETPGVTHETANSAFLCDARRVDGHWYLFYAGSTELTWFEGRGHAKIGVARSTDLEHWEVPPG